MIERIVQIILEVVHHRAAEEPFVKFHLTFVEGELEGDEEDLREAEEVEAAVEASKAEKKFDFCCWGYGGLVNATRPVEHIHVRCLAHVCLHPRFYQVKWVVDDQSDRLGKCSRKKCNFEVLQKGKARFLLVS